MNDKWNYVWVESSSPSKNGVARIWVLYGPQNWCSNCEWIVPGTFDIY